LIPVDCFYFTRSR